MPASWAKAFAPTTALFGAITAPVISLSRRPGFVEFFQVEFGSHAKTILAHGERDGDFFERGVSGAFTDAVDGAFDLAHTRANRGQRVGDGEAEVVMAMGAQHDVLGVA